MRMQMTDMPTTMPAPSVSTTTDPSDALLTLTNIESAYGPVKAIRGVSLEVKKGQIVQVCPVCKKSKPRTHRLSPNIVNLLKQ